MKPNNIKSLNLSLISPILGLLFLLTPIKAFSQDHNPFNILGDSIRALNTGTNGWGLTNLANLSTNLGMIYNPTNVTYTNASGSFVGSSTTYLGYVGTTNNFTVAKLFRDIPLFTDSLGRPIGPTVVWDTATLASNFTFFGHMTLFIEYVNPRGSNAPMGATFRPVWDGVTPSLSSADDWGFRIAGLSTGKGTLATNIPAWKWPGAKSLRCINFTNEYILAGPGAQTNSPFITKFSVNYFKP